MTKPSFKSALLIVALCMASEYALADTSAVSAEGFVVTFHRETRTTPQQLYEAIGRIGKWWSDAHTYSGHAANMSLDLSGPGCFCEKWGGNAVQHAQVIQAWRGSLVRLQGALGPLQALPVNAILTFTMAAAGDSTRLTVTYVVGGNAEAALDKLAGPVDSVIGDAVDRLIAYTDSGKP
jgi:hypothetical protein